MLNKKNFIFHGFTFIDATIIQVHIWNIIQSIPSGHYGGTAEQAVFSFIIILVDIILSPYIILSVLFHNQTSKMFKYL